MYKGKNGTLFITHKWILKLIPVMVLLLVVQTGIVYCIGARNFLQGFVYTFFIWLVLNVSAVVYLRSMRKVIVIGVVVSVIVGFMIQLAI